MRNFALNIILASILFVFDYKPLVADNLSDKIQVLDQFQKENYQELIYIQTDKRAYITGERINIKVFCLEKTTSKPSKLSKVAYVEILDTKNVQKLQVKIELIEGTGYGEIFLPTNINSGNFVLRAYTRWMRNFGPESFFHSMISVINPFKKLGLQPLPENKDVAIRFYPESGKPINGLKTKVVFDCRYPNGFPVEVTGKLMANDTIVIKEFTPDNNGYGSFEFTPDIFNKYHVNLVHNDSSITRHAFPVTTGSGFALQVVENSLEYSVEIFCNDLDLVAPKDELFYVIQQKGTVLIKGTTQLVKGKGKFSLKKSEMEDGIAEIRLFDEADALLQTRKIFKLSSRPVDLLKNKQEYEQRENVSVELAGLENSFEQNNLSISVSNYHDNFSGHLLNLSDYLLIENSLNGFIYGIEGYFQNNNVQEITNSINNLLIAHPAKSVSMTNSADIKKKYIPEYRGAIITGTVLNKETKEPERGIYAFISIPGKNVQFNAARSKAEGQIIFEMKNFYGSNEVIAQTDYSKDSIYTVVIDNPFSDEYINYTLPEINIDKNIQKWVEHQSHNMQINNAYRKYLPNLPVLNKVDSSSFFNEPDSRYFLDDYTRFIVMEEVMREYVYGVNVRKNKDGFHFMTLDLDHNDIFSENPLMLLDGVPIFDADEIIALDPLKIEKIETIKRRFHLGYLDCKGVVNFTSYDGNLAGYNLNKNVVVQEYEGLQPLRQFFKPKYTTPAEKRSTTADFRNTLYWNPDINLDKNADNTVEFYTSDDENQYEIRINGISKNGIPYSKKGFFKVFPSKNN